MPYPLPVSTEAIGGRVRLLSPIGCPGLEQWVIQHEVARWLRLGYRLGSVPAQPLELFWMPAQRLWNEPLGSAAIELTIDPLVKAPYPILVNWGDGQSETISWDSMARDVPRPRHLYLQRQDLTLSVQIGLSVATLQVALVGCPLPPSHANNASSSAGSGTASLAGVEPLLPGSGLSGNAYNGSQAQQWQLRLHPDGGLALLPSPIDGEPALAVMYGSGAASRGTRWYSGDGAPDLQLLNPPPAAGDLYLVRVCGQVFELVA
ncbi:MAG: hypothetical protein R6W06_15325 [Prochlorococcaceae cyanobacterium]